MAPDDAAATRRAERAARNDALFRDANERIDDAAKRLDFPGSVPFVCECADESCRELVRLSLREYRDVRREPTTFVTAPGHEAAETSTVVVARRSRYVVVEKRGAGAEVARELDAGRRGD